MVKPVNVTGVVPTVAVESKVPVPIVASVTPTGAVPAASAFKNVVKTAAAGAPTVLGATSGNTSLCTVSGVPAVKLPVKAVGGNAYESGL